MKIFQRNTNISYVKALFIRDYILNLFLFLSKWIFLLFISRWGMDFILKIYSQNYCIAIIKIPING